MKTSPTQRTLAELRRRGIWWKPARVRDGVAASAGPNGTCEVVERWIPFPKPGHRKDLFGFCDVLVTISVFPRTLAIQACAGGSVANRLAKVDAEPRARDCLAAGWAVEVWGWVRRRDGWALRRVPLSGPLAELPAILDGDSSPAPCTQGRSRRQPVPVPGA